MQLRWRQRSRLALLLSWLVPVATVLAEAPTPEVESVFQSLRAAWEGLGEGFHYKGNSYYHPVALSKFEVRDGRRFLVKVVPSDQFPEERSALNVAWKANSYSVVMTKKGGARTEWIVTGDRIAQVTVDGTVAGANRRTPAAEDNSLREPVFVPSFAWDQWLGYPWPAIERREGERFENRILERSQSKLIAEVFMSYPSSGGTTQHLTRRLTLENLRPLGWLPTHVECLNGAGAVYKSYEFEWFAYLGVAGRTVPVPVKFRYRDFTPDPGSQQPVLNNVAGYEIAVNSFQSLGTAGDALTHFDQRTKRAADWMTPEQTSQAASMKLRPYLLVFVACIAVVAGLLAFRRHQRRVQA